MSSDPKALIAAKFLDSFLREIVLDTAIHTHAKIKRARSICHLCGTRCQAHTPAAEQSATNSALSSAVDSTAPTSRSGTPVPGSSSKPDYYSNNPLFECLVCSRQVSSNRYATHLAKCMGMGSKGGRKGAARNAKVALNSSATASNRQSASATPKYASDLDDDSFAKRKNAAGGAKNGTKRANSPLANARMNKRIKTSSPTPPPSESTTSGTAAGGGMIRSYSSQTFAPSGLSNSTTVLSGSPLNPNNSSNTTKPALSASKLNGSTKASNKRKRILDDDDEDEEDGNASYNDGSGSDGDDSNEEEGEISDDEDIALASRPPSSGTKIKIPMRTTPSSSSAVAKQKTFTIADDSDEDSDVSLSKRLSTRRKTQQHSDDDDDDDEGEEDDDDDDDGVDDEEDDVQVTRINHSSGTAGGNRKKPGAVGGSGLQRERGSDGEFIDVESASEQSDADSF